MKELLRPVVDFPGYLVSNLGIVVSLCYGRPKIHKPFKHSRGYRAIDLWRNKRKNRKYVHELVANAFIGSRPYGYELDHINTDKADNAETNLEYVTPKQNQRRSVKRGTFATGERNAHSKLTADKVREIRRRRKIGAYSGLNSKRFWNSFSNRIRDTTLSSLEMRQMKVVPENEYNPQLNKKKVWPLIGRTYKVVSGPVKGTVAKLIDVKTNGEENIFVVEVLTGYRAGHTTEISSNLIEKGLQDGSIEEVV